MSLLSARMLIVTAVVVGGVLGEAGSPPPAEAQSPPPLPAELLRILARLEAAPGIDETGDVPTTQERPDPEALAVGLRLGIAQLKSLLGTADRRTRLPLRNALDDVQDAWTAYAAGSRSLKLSHLEKTAKALQEAEVSLKVAGMLGGPDTSQRVKEIQRDLAGLAKRIAGDVLRQAQNAGVAPRKLVAAQRLFDLGALAAAEGQYEVAVVHFGGSLNKAADTITFDVDLFEQNIVAAVDGQAVGYAYSIAFDGQLVHGGGANGLARTAADAPQTPQSPNKEMHVASVSKTLTAIVTLRLLAELGLTPDEPIAPYLPSDWILGDGVDQLTFRHFMTHRSGFKQNGVTLNAYEVLQDAIAKDVGDQSYQYTNSNFAMMRVLVAGLAGYDPVDYPQFDAGGLTSAIFLSYAQQVYASIGVQVDCSPSDPTPTVEYLFPDTGLPGYVEPPHPLACGGFGWFISANELAGVMTTLRNTEQLLSDEARALMEEGFLGLMDPADGWGAGNGAFGVYFNHKGDWGQGPGGLDSCVMAFPIVVEASLLINSVGGDYGDQCVVLRDAFDNAWGAAD